MLVMGRRLGEAKRGKVGGKAERNRCAPAKNTAPTERDVISRERNQEVI
jgi:hypothetical protein